MTEMQRKAVRDAIAAWPGLCRVYWGHAACVLDRGHDGLHVDEHWNHPDPGFMFGEDATPAESSELD